MLQWSNEGASAARLHSGVTIVLQWCYDGGRVMLQLDYGSIMMVSQWCYMIATILVQWCHSHLTVLDLFFITAGSPQKWGGDSCFHSGSNTLMYSSVMFSLCYSCAIVVLHWCHGGVTVVLQRDYSGISDATVVLQWKKPSVPMQGVEGV
jgi:hypothetical protein